MNKKTNLKLITGIVGAGFAAHYRCNALKEVFGDNIKLKGIYDINPNNSSAFSKEFTIGQFKKIEDIFNDDEIDTVCVCTPSKYHYEIIEAALNSNKNIICEYPLVVKYEDAKRLIELSNNKGLFIHVGQTMKYDEDKILIVSNMHKLGKLLMGYKYMSFGEIGSWFESKGYENIGTWYTNREETGGWIITSIYHGIQLFRKVFGEVTSVSAVDSSTKNIGAATVLMKHEDGSSSVVQWGMPFLGKAFNLTIVSGSKGSIEMDGNKYEIEIFGIKEKGKLRDPELAYRNVFYKDTETLKKEIEGEEDSFQENLDMLKTLKVSVCADISARKGKTVKLTY